MSDQMKTATFLALTAVMVIIGLFLYFLHQAGLLTLKALWNLRTVRRVLLVVVALPVSNTTKIPRQSWLNHLREPHASGAVNGA